MKAAAKKAGCKCCACFLQYRNKQARVTKTTGTIAGPKFGELEGQILAIRKALYGLRMSGARWHEEISNTLRAIGFKQSYAEKDIWMRKMHNHYG
jgi:hypothetical protein